MTTISAPASANGRIEVRSPAHGRVVGSIPVLGTEQVHELATQLRAAQPAWEALGPDGRAKFLLRWADWLMDNERRLAELVQSESGKAWNDASFEAGICVEFINYYAKNAAEWLAPRDVPAHGPAGAAKKRTLRFRPHPLVGVITPWNGPIGARRWISSRP